MTTDMKAILERLFEEEPPMQLSTEDVLIPSRRRARLRRTGAVTAAGLLTGVAVLGVAAWPGGGPAVDGTSTVQPAAGPSDQSIARGNETQPAAAPVSDAEVRRRCTTADREFVRVSSNKAGGGTDPIGSWSVPVTLGERSWFSAVLVSPDGKRFAYCRDNTAAGEPYDDYVRESVALVKDFKVHVADGGSYGPVPDTVARMTFETPDGNVDEAVVMDGFYLWHTDLEYLDIHGKAVWARFYDASGRLLAKVNANPPASSTPAVIECEPVEPRQSLTCKPQR